MAWVIELQYDRPIRDKSAQDYLDDFLIKRKSQIDRNPSLKTKDRITQRGVWYRIRPIMISEGFEPKENRIKERRPWNYCKFKGYYVLHG